MNIGNPNIKFWNYNYLNLHKYLKQKDLDNISESKNRDTSNNSSESLINIKMNHDAYLQFN